MTTPTNRFRDAQHINYGFLAVNTAEALTRLLKNKQQQPEDNETLENAERFLKQIRTGVELVSTGRYQGGNSIASMDALDTAIGPLEDFQKSVHEDDEISDTVKHMAKVLRKAINHPQKLDSTDRQILKNMPDFFYALNESLIDRINKDKSLQRRSPRTAPNRKAG